MTQIYVRPNYLVTDRVTKRFITYELRWFKKWGEFEVVTLKADGDYLTKFATIDEAEARREFARVTR